MWSKTERGKWAKRESTTSMSLFQEPGKAGEQLLKRPGAVLNAHKPGYTPQKEDFKCVSQVRKWQPSSHIS